MVKDLNNLPVTKFLEAISRNFRINESTEPVIPAAMHEFGMYLDGAWYQLHAFPENYKNENPLSGLDVTILQEYILSPILDIADPRTDPRISYRGSLLPLNDMISKVDKAEYAVAFTMFPTTIDQLIHVADEGEAMPPKSTWFEPKFDVGLLIHQIN